MRRLYRPITTAIRGVALFLAFGTIAYATDSKDRDTTIQSCVNDIDFVVPNGMGLYGVLSNQTLGSDYLIRAGTNLGVIAENNIDKVNGITQLNRTLNKPISSIKVRHKTIVQAENGQKYILRKNTVVNIISPNIIMVKIAEGTPLTKASDSQEYILAEDTSIKIPTLSENFSSNYRATLKVDSQIVDWITPKTSGMSTTVEFEPPRAPKGEYITLTMKQSGFNFGKAQFYVCLNEHGKGDEEYIVGNNLKVMKAIAGEVELKVKIPNIKKNQNFSAIPANLLVVAITLDGNLSVVKSQDFVVSSRQTAIFWWIVAFLFPWIIAGFINTPKSSDQPTRFSAIWFVSGKYGNASLSLAQILLWTVLVFSSSFYVWEISGKLLDITPEVLILLGITGGSSLIAKIAASTRNETGRAIAGQPPSTPKWLDLIQTEGRPDLYKIQMALFTTLAAVFVIFKIYETLKFPELPAGLLTLIGISNGVYLGAKVSTNKSVYEKLSDADKKLQKALTELNLRKVDTDMTVINLEAAKKEQANVITLRDKTKAELDKVQNADNKTALEQQLKQRETAVNEAESRVDSANQKNKEAIVAKNAADIEYKKCNTDFENLKKEASDGTKK